MFRRPKQKRRTVPRRSRGRDSQLVRFTDVSANPAGSSVVRFNGSYMPPRFINKMTVVSTWTCTTAGGFGYYTYRMNSVYDPYVGAGGDACHGIDELQAIYDRYKVHRSTITVTATAQGDDVTQVLVHPSANADTPTMTSAESAPETKHAIVTKYKASTITFSTPMSRWLEGANDRDCGALTTADPVAVAYWKILLQNGTASALNVVLRVQLVFDVEWSHLKASNDVDA